ncbi:unnamed protein product [Cylicostephanus goldi]|uniref:Uncharacterized protein n=1 Tax=Cylicostephanus goldi TaxID=71465 RepID=A0A3P6TDG7_CYLGO|nr:unnamed protein product [Cylicostephanus goldi]
MKAAEVAGYIVTEWEDCLKCASVIDMSYAIRSLCANILLYCKPTNPIYLWEQFKNAMRNRRRNCNESANLDLRPLNHIKTILGNNGASLEDFELRNIKEALLLDCDDDFINRASPEIKQQTDNIAESLTLAQKRVANAVIAASRRRKGDGNKLFYIDGKADLAKLIQSDPTASNGIAATLLKHGRTERSLFCLPIKQLHSWSTANIDASSPIGQALNTVDVKDV